MKQTVLKIGLDFTLLMSAFVVVHVLNYGHINISYTNWYVFKFLILCWFCGSILMRKFTRIDSISLIRALKLLIKVGIIMFFLISLFVVGMQLMYFSRTMAYGTIIVFVILETVAIIVYHRVRGPIAFLEVPSLNPKVPSVSHPLIILDGLLLVASIFIITFLKQGNLILSHPYNNLLIILLGLWLIGSMITKKFEKVNFIGFFVAFGPALKTIVFMTTGLAFFIFILRLGPISRFQVFGPLLFFLPIEGVVFMLYTNYRKYNRYDGKIENPDKNREMDVSVKDQIPLEPLSATPVVEPVSERIKHALDFFDSNIFELLQAKVDLRYCDRRNCALMSTDNMFNFDVLESNSMRLIINLHKINDIRWFNRYFLLAHEKLLPGGYLIGKAYTISTHREHFRKNYSKGLGILFYSFSFAWKRVFPKLPLLQKFYFAVTGGRDRIVSRAEILGRLCFCGFKIIDEKEINNQFFFVAQKVNTPSVNKNPSYGPIVRLNRMGHLEHPFTVFKFRTMYPFSEYLQEYVYEKNNLAKGGKFQDDFRVTGWGRFLRRTWLDELPMLYNWFRGDLKIVGVRPLSSQYLKLYTAEIQQLRKQVKPGLLPPFYADMPMDLEGIMESERRYIEAFLVMPARTQVKYFGKCLWNIGMRKKRSQ